MAFLIFLFVIIASDTIAGEENDPARVSDALATAQSQSSLQKMAVDDKSSSSAGSAERSVLELVTNRRKVLTESSTLADVASEDVISPQKETVLVIQSAEGADTSASSPSSRESGTCEGQKIGLSYKDSIPCSLEPAKAPKGSPNVVFLVLDDIGFGGLGCFGGPVQTPNIDRLAAEGLSYSNFHTTGICSPTRACLLTGRNLHSVGVGVLMEFPAGYPGYTTYLSNSAATMPQMLKEQGYNTYCVGKWHLTPGEETSMAASKARWPLGRARQQLQIKVIGLGGHGAVDQAHHIGQGHHGGLLRGHGKAAIEIPQIGPFGQGLATLTAQVFADFVFDGFEAPIGMLPFGMQGKSFLHGQWYRPCTHSPKAYAQAVSHKMSQ